jgi:acyl-CoA reductase-like NAD-dependent aldehyde dehydrogenase
MSTGSVQDLTVPAKLFINNEYVDAVGGSTLPVYAPHTGQELQHIANAAGSDVDDAVRAARDCFEQDWSQASSLDKRCEVMRSMARELREQHERFAQVESSDCGKPLTESRADIDMCASVFEYYADMAPSKMAPKTLDTQEEGYNAQIIKEPVGVAGYVSLYI